MTLDDLRAQIDACDDEIVGILVRRMEIVAKVGALKAKDSGVVYRPEREKQIISRLKERVKNTKVKASGIENIFYEIFSLSRALEGSEKIAFLGPLGTYTHEASLARFGLEARYEALSTIEAVFKEVESGNSKFGVVPIENNTEGGVSVSLDSLKNYKNVKIIGEIFLEINHNLAGVCGDLKSIKRIYSHPQAYGQCRKFISSHGLDLVQFCPTESTAGAAASALSDENGAAICSKAAISINKLPILAQKIQDNEGNRTRFLVLSDFWASRSGNDKTSIIVSLKHRPGALFDMLGVFKERNINITKLESRPQKCEDFSYLFYLDFDGHKDDENVDIALKELAKHTNDLQILGSYVKG